MEDTLKYQTIFEKRQQFGWKLGAALLLVSVFFIGRVLLSNGREPIHLTVFAFSAEEEVLTEGIFPAFEQAWKAETKVDLTIEGVFGPSGTLAGQINLGAPVDIAIFSNLNQVNWLQLGDLVSSDARMVVIGTSPIVIVTRPGNPYNLEKLADLSIPGLDLLHANPGSSGVAEWALLAEYGDALKNTGASQAAEVRLQAIWRNVRILAPSARELLTLFELGVGDAFLTYEQEALFAQKNGVPLEIIMPVQTIIAQPVAVVIDGNVKRSEQAVVQAFMDFLISESGQEIFSHYFLRPVGLQSDFFTPIEQPFTVDDFGGWSHLYTNQVKPFWEREIGANVELEPLSGYYNLGR